jgi:S1-C subfamily serine protease
MLTTTTPFLTRLLARLWACMVVLALLAGASMPASAASECSMSAADIYQKKSPAVVRITSLTINPYRTDDRVQLATGSGFIIDESGLIMTNSHVVFGAQALEVSLDNGTVLTAKLVGADPILDLAVLRIPLPDSGKLPVLEFADSDKVRPGDPVVAIGNPLGLSQSITSGIVSAINRILPERPRMLTWPMIQIDTPINPGNSGGPVLNRCGEVVGIASEILGDAQNIGFAIPSNLARSIAPALVEHGRLIRPWFGIDGTMIDDELIKIFSIPLTQGFLVEAVEPNSPASLAGISGGGLPVRVALRSLILGGDIITSINDIELVDEDSFRRALELIRVGATVHLKVFREGESFSADLSIVERPLQPGDVPGASQSFPGFSPQEQGDSNNK